MRTTIRTAFLAILVSMAPGLPAALAQEVPNPEITQDEIMKHIKFMADDALEGRASGSPGAMVTAEYIAEYFKFAGLEPIGDEGTYYQKFSLPRGFRALPTTTVKSTRGSRVNEFEFGEDITVMPNSAAGAASGPALFAGYGVSAPMFGYDDYEGEDAKGKIVIIMRGIPGGRRGPLSSRQAVQNFCTYKAKLDTAAGMGAAALIIINDPEEHGSRGKDALIEGGREAQGAIPFIHMTYKAGGKLLSGTGVSLGRVQTRIDKAKKPMSRDLPDLTVEVNAGIEPIKLDVRNVVGILRAEGEGRTSEAVVVGGHFDHVGLGEFGSRGGSKARGEVHNGADDNASGTAAVIEIAEYLASRRHELRRDVVFAAFTAEEMGLLGSAHYVDSPPVPLGNTVAMVNLDMVGRLNRGELFIGGVGTSSVFEEVIDEANRKVRLKLSLGQGGRAPTDSTSFYNKEIPVLFFNTGLHKDYHLPSDDWKLIDERGAEKVVRLAAGVTFELVSRPERPPFTRADTGGFRSGPYLGLTVSQKADGVYVTDVERKSPASKSGFREDDKILEFQGQQIETAADFYGVKSQCPPGKRVTIVIRRQGRVRTLKPQLGK